MQKKSLLTSLVSVPFIAGLVLGVTGTALTADVMGSAIFPDVPAGSYYDAAVGRMQAAGYMKGSPDGKFNPAAPVTRADLAVILDRALFGGGSTQVSSRSSSSRVSSSSSSSVNTSTDAGNFHFTVGTFNVSNKAGDLTISIIRSGGTKGTATVDFSTTAGTAIADQDFVAAPVTISFKDGESSKLISIRIINNTAATSNRTFTVNLTNPTGGATVSSPSSSTVTIIATGKSGSTAPGTGSSSYSSVSSAAGGTFGFSATVYSVAEAGGAVTVTVNRSGSTSSAATVEYATSDGTGRSGVNYNQTQGTLSFAVGESSKTFSVQALDNTTIDGNKTATLTLKNPGGGSNLGYPSTATLTVVDDENGSGSGSTVQFSSDMYIVSESQGAATIVVTRTGDMKTAVSVNYSTTDSSAIAGGDYTATSGTLNFASGESSKFFIINIIKDSNSESDEIANLTLSNPSGTQLGMQYGSTLKIRE